MLKTVVLLHNVTFEHFNASLLKKVLVLIKFELKKIFHVCFEVGETYMFGRLKVDYNQLPSCAFG